MQSLWKPEETLSYLSSPVLYSVGGRSPSTVKHLICSRVNWQKMPCVYHLRFILIDLCISVINRQSYDIDLELESPGSEVKSTNRLDLKNPLFHYTGQQVLQGGAHTTSPSESYWSQLGNGNAMDAGGSTLGNGYSNGQGLLSTGVVQSIPIGKQILTLTLTFIQTLILTLTLILIH